MTPSEERQVRISALQFALELVNRHGGHVDYGMPPIGHSHRLVTSQVDRIATKLHDEITAIKVQDRAAQQSGTGGGAG